MSVAALRKAAEAAWSDYTSTCGTGGTKEQRAWAYEKASRAEERLRVIENQMKQAPSGTA